MKSTSSGSLEKSSNVSEGRVNSFTFLIYIESGVTKQRISASREILTNIYVKITHSKLTQLDF